MKSQLQKFLNAKRSVVIAGHKTSVSLEDAFWKSFNEIAASRNMTLSDLLATIDSDRQHGNLSSAIRLFVLDHYRAQVEPSAGADQSSYLIRGCTPAAVSAARCSSVIARSITSIACSYLIKVSS